MLRVTVIFAFLFLAKAQEVTNTCQFTHVEETKDLDFASLNGLWNLVSSTSNNLGNGSCTTFTFNNTAGTVTLSEKVSGEENTVTGTWSSENSANDTARFTLTFNNTPAEIFVVGTNYNGYALMYNCEETSNTTKSVSVWTLSRNITLSEADQTIVNNITSSHADLSGTSLVLTDHSSETCSGSSTLKISTILFALVFGVRRLFSA